MQNWKRTLFVVAGSQLLTMIAFSAYLPSMPFYIQQMGNMSTAETTNWLAVFNSGSAIAMMIASPLWGGLSDRYGRKMMLVRATFFGALLAFAMGLAQTPTQLIVIRTLQGILCGTVSASMTLIATQTPEEHMGTSLGMMQTVQYVGNAVGPLIGGLVADTMGLRAMFPAAGVLMTIAFVATMLGVQEKFEPAPRVAKQPGQRWQMPRLALYDRSVMVALLTMAILSLALAMLSPVLSLYIQALKPDAPNISTLAGSAVSVAALTSSVAALLIGRLGDKYGQKQVLLLCAIGVALVNIPQALVRTPMELIIWRAVQGIFIGGIMPTATAIMATGTDPNKRGTLFGIANSMRAAGRAIGPAMGAGMSNQWGMASVFYGVTAMYALIAGMVAAFVRPSKPVHTEPIEIQPAECSTH